MEKYPIERMNVEKRSMWMRIEPYTSFFQALWNPKVQYRIK